MTHEEYMASRGLTTFHGKEGNCPDLHEKLKKMDCDFVTRFFAIKEYLYNFNAKNTRRFCTCCGRSWANIATLDDKALEKIIDLLLENRDEFWFSKDDKTKFTYVTLIAAIHYKKYELIQKLLAKEDFDVHYKNYDSIKRMHEDFGGDCVRFEERDAYDILEIAKYFPDEKAIKMIEEKINTQAKQ